MDGRTPEWSEKPAASPCVSRASAVYGSGGPLAPARERAREKRRGLRKGYSVDRPREPRPSPAVSRGPSALGTTTRRHQAPQPYYETTSDLSDPFRGQFKGLVL